MLHPSLFSYFTVTNNSYIVERVSNTHLVRGSALDVLIKARDMIHIGWSLVTNPLYGNFKPNQQPYRTIVLCKREKIENLSPNLDNLPHLEEAIAIYKRAAVIRKPGELPEKAEADFRELDFMLLLESFRNCRILLSR